MPSARELLEQADALMRRNRSPLMDDIPVLTDSVPEARVAPPARVRPSLPPDEPDSIPMLTESVEEEPAPRPQAKGPAVVEEGEPSDWLQLGGAEPSVIGEAPDSIAIVPPFREEPEVIEVEAPPEIEESFDAELAEREGSHLEPPPVQVEGTPAEIDDPVAQSDELAGEIDEPSAQLEDVHPDIDEPPAVTQSEGPAPADTPWELDRVVEEPVEEGEAAVETVDASPAVQSVAFEEISSIEEPEAERTLEEARAVDLASPADADRAADEARWASMAEEIRMQVLQRIDLFTDTGLRDQLGARLQPIVDRASADLVATINQHVGELLRAYVAEAIEREIENWKRNTENF